MTDYYVDPLNQGGGTPTPPYTAPDWSDAADDLQLALDLATTAGDQVFCRGSQTLSTAMLVKAANIRIIGCDAAGTPKAGQFELDAANTASVCLDCQSFNQLQLYNLTAKNALTHGIDAENCELPIYEGLRIHNNTSNGLHGNFNHRYGIMRRCHLYANGGVGFFGGYDWELYASVFHDNGSHGFSGSFLNVLAMTDCLFYKNSVGYYNSGGSQHLFFRGNVFADHTSHGIQCASRPSRPCLFVGNRITGNGGYGILISTAGDWIQEDYNVFFGNDSGARYNIAAGPNSIDNPADDGFVDSASGDYNVKVGAELRSEPIVL